MIECKQCKKRCKNQDSLDKHNSEAKFCHKYKNIVFLCSICDFYTIGIQNINTHIKTCNSQNVHNTSNLLSKQAEEIESHKLLYRIKKKNYNELRLQLNFEKIKTQIYSHIIETNLNINLHDIIHHKEDTIIVNNLKGYNIPIIVNNIIDGKNETAEYNMTPKKLNFKPIQCVVKKTDQVENKEKHIYRTVKSVIPVQENIENNLKNNIPSVDEGISTIVTKKFNDSSKQDIIEKIDSIFVEIKENRLYTKFLLAIRNIRCNLLGKISVQKYKEMLLTHNQKLISIFEQKQQHAPKQITKNISKSLTPLDARLIDYGDYVNSPLEIDDINRLVTALKVTTVHDKKFVPFNMTGLCDKILNYSLAFQPWIDCVSDTAFNLYNFHNFIYLPLPKSLDNDPYSFYTLEKIEKDKRCWNMECRLENFSHDLVEIIRNYCIHLFKKLYYKVFQDNQYRSDYKSHSQITELDCEQLLQNIISLSQPFNSCLSLRKLIKEKATFSASEKDKFNIRSDDALQKKQFRKMKYDPKLVQDSIKILFDGISSDECDQLLLVSNNS